MWRLILIFSLVLTSCGAPAAAPVPTWTPEATRRIAITIEVAPTPTATAIPTPTLAATATLTPTRTATPTTIPTKVPTKVPTRRPTLPPAARPLLPTATRAPIVQPTTAAPQVPAGATAICVDGTYSFSQHRRGTCSHHGGVRTWLANLPP